MTIAYIDCFAGIAGDMLLGALLDAGASEERVRSALDSLELDGWEMSVTEVTRAGLRATRATVTTHDADTARSYRDMVTLLEAAPLEEAVARMALEVFGALGGAESTVHGVPLDEVHFHEVGSPDALIDIVGCSAAWADLSPETALASPVGTGTGSVTTAHGLMPLPVPAVTQLLTGAPFVGRGDTELVTPTGAALLSVLADGFDELPAMTLSTTGYGAGSRDLAFPNVVRVLLGAELRSSQRGEGEIIDTNLDDLSPELLPHVVECLMGAGAQDAWITPIIMKKGRPGYSLSVLTDRGHRTALLEVLYRETSTLGARVTPVVKEALDRSFVEVTIEGLPMRVKVGRRHGRVTTVSPEHDDARRLASETGLPLKEVYARALRAAEQSGTS
ncbi:nickel pincer cofactor biosynthesis protein LarC [soil metagenome]